MQPPADPPWELVEPLAKILQLLLPLLHRDLPLSLIVLSLEGVPLGEGTAVGNAVALALAGAEVVGLSLVSLAPLLQAGDPGQFEFAVSRHVLPTRAAAFAARSGETLCAD
jgi:hypothetical protein